MTSQSELIFAITRLVQLLMFCLFLFFLTSVYNVLFMILQPNWGIITGNAYITLEIKEPTYMALHYNTYCHIHWILTQSQLHEKSPKGIHPLYTCLLGCFAKIPLLICQVRQSTCTSLFSCFVTYLIKFKHIHVVFFRVDPD